MVTFPSGALSHAHDETGLLWRTKRFVPTKGGLPGFPSARGLLSTEEENEWQRETRSGLSGSQGHGFLVVLSRTSLLPPQALPPPRGGSSCLLAGTESRMRRSRHRPETSRRASDLPLAPSRRASRSALPLASPLSVRGLVTNVSHAVSSASASAGHPGLSAVCLFCFFNSTRPPGQTII